MLKAMDFGECTSLPSRPIKFKKKKEKIDIPIDILKTQGGSHKNQITMKKCDENGCNSKI